MDRMSTQLDRIRIRIEASHHALESMIGLARSTTSFLTPLVDIGDNPAVAAHHAVQAWHCALENEVIANRDAFEVCTLAENLQETIPEQLNHRIFNILSPWSAAIEDECHSTGGYGRSAPGLVPLPLCEWCGSFLMPVMTTGWKGLREYCEEVIESFDSILVRTPFPQSMGHALVLARSDLINLTQMLREQDLKKLPSISETLDWARVIMLLHADDLTPHFVHDTLNVLLKFEQDIHAIRPQIGEITRKAMQAGDYGYRTSNATAT